MEAFAIPGAGGIIEKTVDGVTYILVQERWKEDSPAEEGFIEIPAGKIREFENIYDCLRREIKEETGLTVTQIDGESDAGTYECNGYKVLNYMPFSCSQNTKGYYPIMVQVFICRAEGELLNKSGESKNMRWISLKELKNIIDKNTSRIYPMHVHTLKKYLERKNC